MRSEIKDFVVFVHLRSGSKDKIGGKNGREGPDFFGPDILQIDGNQLTESKRLTQARY